MDHRIVAGPGRGPHGVPAAIALSPILSARYRARDLERIRAAAPGARLVTVSIEGLADGPLDDVEVLLRGFLSAEAFDPTPKVESAIVRMIPRPSSQLLAGDEDLFAKLVTTAFSQRRKTIRNTLINLLAPDDFAKLNLDSTLRAENLSVPDYVNITNYLNGK
jgi:hypothetical protein